MASLVLFNEKCGELPVDTRYTYGLEIFYIKASIPPMRKPPDHSEQILILSFELVSLEQVAIGGYEKEVACITMPEGDLLSTNVIVSLVNMSIRKIMAYLKHQQEPRVLAK